MNEAFKKYLYKESMKTGYSNFGAQAGMFYNQACEVARARSLELPTEEIFLEVASNFGDCRARLEKEITPKVTKVEPQKVKDLPKF